MPRPKSLYVSAFDKITESLKALTSRVLRLVEDRADEGWDNVRTNKDGLADRIAELIAVSVNANDEPAPHPMLHRLYDDEKIMIGATNGQETMARAKNVFTGYLDPDFKNWGTDAAGRPTQQTGVAVYELRQNATFNQMFRSLGDPNTLIWEQSQIIKFCQEYRNRLRQEGYATFFLFKFSDEFFVARVNVDAGKLEAPVHRFDGGHVWSADGRLQVVVPQL